MQFYRTLVSSIWHNHPSIHPSIPKSKTDNNNNNQGSLYPHIKWQMKIEFCESIKIEIRNRNNEHTIFIRFKKEIPKIKFESLYFSRFDRIWKSVAFYLISLQNRWDLLATTTGSRASHQTNRGRRNSSRSTNWCGRCHWRSVSRTCRSN